MPELIEPTVRLETAWREAHEEWGSGLHEDGFDVRPSDDVDTSAGFAAWVRRLVEQADPTLPLDSGRIRRTNRWMLDKARSLGLNRVLLVCADDNAASSRTIEHHGGALEDVRATELGLVRRYWIALS